MGAIERHAMSYQKTPALNPSAGSGYVLPNYPFSPPPELSEGQSNVHPVVIVGAGLAGLTAACDFALRGIPAVVIDEDDTVGVKGASSRGICYAQKSLEIFQRLGIYERIKAKGVQWSVGKTLAGDDIIYEFDLATQASHNASEQPPFINLQQFYLEWFLVDRIQELGVSTIRWQSRVKAITHTDGYALLEVETPQGPYTLKAQWVIDASGLRSPIREASGLKLEQALGIDRWCISDVKFKDKKPIERWTWIEAPFNDNRAVWQHLMADDVWRLDYQMEADADPEAVSHPDVVTDRLKRHLGDDVEFELVWVGPYAYKSHLLERFHDKRVFFVGDCAHVMSPFGARGGNSAIQDADNLVWKLAMVLEGNAQPSILDSYSDERRDGAQTNIQITNRTTRFLSPKTQAEKLTRNAVIELAKTYPFARTLVNTGRLSTANTYTVKPLVMADLNAAIGSVTSQPIQNFSLTFHRAGKPPQPADLCTVMCSSDFLPLLVFKGDKVDQRLGEVGLSLSALADRFSVKPVQLLRSSPGLVTLDSVNAVWPTLQIEAILYDRLCVDLGLNAPNIFAILRPDMYSGGACDAKSLAKGLVSLGLERSPLSQRQVA
jgi:3-(3-hydroxy-phenyl)propionate hydroxylase